MTIYPTIAGVTAWLFVVWVVLMFFRGVRGQ